MFLSSFFLKFNRIQNPMFFSPLAFRYFWLDAVLFLLNLKSCEALLSFSVNNHLKGTHFGISSLDKLCTPILVREQKYLVNRSIEWHTIMLINGCSVFTQAMRSVIARFKFMLQSKPQIKVLIKSVHLLGGPFALEICSLGNFIASVLCFFVGYFLLLVKRLWLRCRDVVLLSYLSEVERCTVH